MITRTPAKLFLSQIVRLSPFNPRTDEDGDLGGLIASIRAIGVNEPLKVTRDGADYLVLDGSRRWRALCEIRLGAAQDMIVPCEVIEGDEQELRELAIASNVHRLNLHPVAEYEAFARLSDAGASEQQIASDNGLTLRRVRQILALGNMAPPVRAAWREGKITRDLAEVFADCDSHERQAEVLTETLAKPEFARHARTVRIALRNDWAEPDCAEALFIGADAYLAAGGRIHESLFDEESYWSDGALLRRLAQQKLESEARRIQAAEGWGFVFYDQYNHHEYDRHERQLDMPLSDHERAETLQNEGEEIGLQNQMSDDDRQRLAEILREHDAMLSAGALRTFSDEERAGLGICIDYDDNGFLEVTRCILPSDFTAAPRNDVDQPDDAGDPDKTDDMSEPAPAPRAEMGKALRETLDATVQTALYKTIARRPDCALMIAVAALASRYGAGEHGASLRATLTQEIDYPLLDEMADAHGFAECLALAAAAELNDLTVAFAHLVGASFQVDGRSFENLSRLTTALARRGAAFGRELHAAFDAPAYFAAAARAPILATIETLDHASARDAAKLKKDEMAQLAARLAQDRQWLPSPLDAWAQLAHAERETEECETEATHTGAAPQDIVDLVRGFFDARTIATDDDAPHTKASDMHTAFVVYAMAQGAPAIPALGQFGQITTQLGYTKKRANNGVFYVGRALAPTTFIEAAQ